MWIRILLSSCKIARKTLILTVFWLLLDFLSLKNDVKDLQKVISRKTLFKKLPSFLLASWRSMTKIAGSRSGSEYGSGSISQRHWSADPDPDPHQNVMDPEHSSQSVFMVLLHNGGFCNGCMAKRCLHVSQEMCHIVTMFHRCFMIRYKSNILVIM